MKKILFIITFIFSTLIAQPDIERSVPMSLSFQGVLSNADGTNYEDGDYDLTFKIMFSTLQGNEVSIWEETKSVNVANGLFSTILGSATELPVIIPANAELEIQVGEEVLSPRTAFTSVPFSITSNYSGIAGQAMMADSSMTAVNAITAINANFSDSSSFSSESAHAVHADTASYVDLSSIAMPVSYINYADNDITLPDAWTVILQLTVDIPSPMKIHSRSFMERIPDSGIGGGYATQIALADESGNFLDMGSGSARFPNAAVNLVHSDYVFEVQEGTYVLALYAIGNGLDLARSVFLEAIGIPSQSSQQTQRNIELNQSVFPGKMGEPLRLEN